MEIPLDVNIPFFTYGLFKPGQLGFSRIKELISDICFDCTIKGELLERDGLPIVNEVGNGQIKGVILYFKNENSNCEAAYQRIIEIEPDKHYRWGVVKAKKSSEEIMVNVLLGRKPNKGSVHFEELEWDGSKDPLFTTALEVIHEVLIDNSNFDWGLKSLFKLQMAYLLLWTCIERYVSLKYHLGDKVMEKIYHIANEEEFQRSLIEIIKAERSVQRADRPDDKVVLNPSDPKKCIEYYYQVRSNITHRGKAVINDFERVKVSLEELLEIFKRVLKTAFNTENQVK